mmetsp:Transcript_8197/g.27051  ORF Transcript_8197/g.27051 Transcript_8197/m.27051 type:complete len:289 (-) Transcript_8197:429-1295(-)
MRKTDGRWLGAEERGSHKAASARISQVDAVGALLLPEHERRVDCRLEVAAAAAEAPVEHLLLARAAREDVQDRRHGNLVEDALPKVEMHQVAKRGGQAHGDVVQVAPPGAHRPRSHRRPRSVKRRRALAVAAEQRRRIVQLVGGPYPPSPRVKAEPRRRRSLAGAAPAILTEAALPPKELVSPRPQRGRVRHQQPRRNPGMARKCGHAWPAAGWDGARRRALLPRLAREARPEPPHKVCPPAAEAGRVDKKVHVHQQHAGRRLELSARAARQRPQPARPLGPLLLWAP